MRRKGTTTPSTTSLSRRIGPGLLTLYGLGTMLGAGIYVLIGEIAGTAGLLAPLAFLVAAFIAAVTVMSYAQLAVLFPRSAGEVVYVRQGLKKETLSRLTGWLIILTGIVSSATLANGFIGYAQIFIVFPEWLGVILITGLFGAVAILGIAQAMWVSALMTVVEVAGLLLVLAMTGDVMFSLPHTFGSYFLPASLPEWSGVFSAAFLAFYAFIGFEDMVNVAEEVKQPEKNIPRAIFLSIAIASLLYILVVTVAVSRLSPATLAGSDAPLSLLLAGVDPRAGQVIAAISLFAIVNGVLVQIVMGSRVLYGMASDKAAPAIFAVVNPRTRTPVYATLVIIFLVMVFALWLPLVTLARLTSFVILLIFALVNLSLIGIRRNAEYAPQLKLRSFPWLGFVLCTALLLVQVYDFL